MNGQDAVQDKSMSIISVGLQKGGKLTGKLLLAIWN
jgi:hypothetical protein